MDNLLSLYHRQISSYADYNLYVIIILVSSINNMYLFFGEHNII